MRDLLFNLRGAIALAFFAVVLLGVLIYRNTMLIRADEQAIGRAHMVTQTLLRLFSDIQEAETSERGFVITEQDEYLQPYFRGVQDIDEALSSLSSLIERTPDQLNRLNELEQLVNARKLELQAVVDLRSSMAGQAGFEAARDLMLMKGRESRTKIHSLIAEIAAEENRLSLEHEAKSKELTSGSQWMIVISHFVALTLISWAGFSASFYRQKRDRAEQDLRSGRAELAAMIDSAMMGVIAFGNDLRIRRVNPEAARFYGLTANSAPGMSLMELFPERLRASISESVHDFILSNETDRIITGGWALRSNGVEFPCEGCLTKSYAEGRPFITLMVQDMTERHTGRAAMRERDAMLEQLHDAIHVCDMDDRITFWNRGAEKLYGISSKDAVGRNVVDVLYKDKADRWLDHHSRILQGETVTDELEQLTHSGKKIIVEHRRSLISSHDGKPIGQLVINTDITDRKRAEASVRQRQRLESLGRLAGGIAHDLNNVLTPILMSAKLIKRSDQNRLPLADTIVASATHGADMIKKLLSFAGGESSRYQPIDPKAIFDSTRSILESTFPKNIELHFRMAKDVSTVRGNATEISQVLMNLLLNAKDAMPDGGELSLDVQNASAECVPPNLIATFPDRVYVQFLVRDNGTGIAPEHLDQIFDPFFTTKAQDKGTGLGLANAMGIIQSHEGEIIVESQLGVGTSIAVYVPAVTAVTECVAYPVLPEVELSGTELVQIVDDEESILIASKATLEARGYSTLIAQSGMKAIEQFTAHGDDIALTIVDMMMPDKDGKWTADELLRIRPNHKIVAASGLRKPSLTPGEFPTPECFLAKPYSDIELLSIVRKTIDSTPKGVIHPFSAASDGISSDNTRDS